MLCHNNVKETNRSKKEKLVGYILSRIFYGYLWLVNKTVKYEIRNIHLLKELEMLGYWHGDSSLMMILLMHLNQQLPPVDVVITADWRGDIISYILDKCRANSIRTEDGLGARKNLRLLIKTSSQKDRIFALAMDGPLGPRHKPKELLPYLAKKANSDIYFVSFTNSPSINLKKRWDNYSIPLPFSRIEVVFEKYKNKVN